MCSSDLARKGGKGAPGMYRSTGYGIAHSPAGELAGADTILEKYQIKIQRVYLDAKEANLGLRSKMRNARLKIDTYAIEYGKDPTSVKRSEVIVALKEANTLQQKMHSTQKKAMEKIKVLNDKRDVEIQKALDKWLKKIENNQGEFDKYMKMLQTERGDEEGFDGERKRYNDDEFDRDAKHKRGGRKGHKD